MKNLKNLMLLVCVLAAFTSCGQPRVWCFASIGSFAAKYELREGTGPCSELKGDVLGVATYNPPDENNRPNLRVNDVAIGSRSLGALAERALGEGIVDEAEGHRRNALGTFTTLEPDDVDVCTLGEMQPAHLAFPELPEIPADPEVEGDEGTPALPATDISYSWSDLEFYVTAGTRGQQWQGTLTYTVDGCEAVYDVRAVFPAVDCTGDDGGPDARWCSPEPNEINGGAGSGIQPEFPTVCDPDLLLCVLKGDDFPVLQAPETSSNAGWLPI